MENKECKHENGYMNVRVGTHSEPDKTENYSLYHCYQCDCLFRAYDNGKIITFPPKTGLVTAVL
jgi:hypothetical protein